MHNYSSPVQTHTQRILSRLFPQGRAATSRKRLVWHKRPKLERSWINIAVALPRPKQSPMARTNLWQLVLQARQIPFLFQPYKKTVSLYVPTLLAEQAIREITEFEAEKPYHFPVAQPLRKNIWGVVAVLSLLLVWHLVRMQGWAIPLLDLPQNPRQWLELGGLNSYATRYLGQWWRAFTALTLHSDFGHLASNLALGTLFLGVLCGRRGLGVGFALTVLAAAMGNIATTFYRAANVLSAGFSSAVFAALGLITASMLRDALNHHIRWQTVIIPVGIALAFLALLGTSGENTDVAAHVFGLLCGVALGLCTLSLHSIPPAYDRLVQVTLLLITLLFFIFCWYIAFSTPLPWVS